MFSVMKVLLETGYSSQQNMMLLRIKNLKELRGYLSGGGGWRGGGVGLWEVYSVNYYQFTNLCPFMFLFAFDTPHL